jgi:hypothetical protein
MRPEWRQQIWGWAASSVNSCAGHMHFCFHNLQTQRFQAFVLLRPLVDPISPTYSYIPDQ